MTIYRDRVVLTEDITEIAYRSGSVEVNRSSDTIYAYRVARGDCWVITSSNNRKELDQLKNKLEKIASSLEPESCGELAEAELYEGRNTVGKPSVPLEQIEGLVVEQCTSARQRGASFCEAIVVLGGVKKLIERDDGSSALEERYYATIEVALSPSLHSAILASSLKASIAWSDKTVYDLVEKTFQEALSRLRYEQKAKRPSIYLIGRTKTVLSYEASAAVFHELSHLLSPSVPGYQNILGVKLCSDSIDIYDDPLEYRSPTLRFFDDEGVYSSKRTLIESGRVIDLHHTRSTARIYESRPGSAYGLFHKPVGFHTTLVVSAGDWRKEEIIEETRQGVYVESIAAAMLEKGYIRVIPSLAYRIERGELREPIRLRELKIPLNLLRSIDAVTRSRKLRVSYEKKWLVAENTPMIRLEAHIF